MPEDLSQRDEWDLDGAEVRKPVKKSRAVVSVAFSPDDFAAVSHAAKQEGTPISTYIRRASLSTASGVVAEVEPSLMTLGSTGAQISYMNATIGPPSQMIVRAFSDEIEVVRE